MKKAVEQIPSIKTCYRQGLSALTGTDRNKVRVEQTRQLSGSVNLDSCLKGSQPNAPRWDYVIGYSRSAYFMEVHPAGTGEVPVVIAKLIWLKGWLNGPGSALNAIKAENPFHWISTNRISVLAGSKYERQLAKVGLGLPKRILNLPA